MITAKIRLQSKVTTADGQALLTFVADYDDGRNREWAKYTPALNLTMAVTDEVAQRFAPGKAFTLGFVEVAEGD